MLLNLSYNEFRSNCLFASIAHAIGVVTYPVVSNEQSWDGLNYSVQNSSGMRGTISFGDGFWVAAFRNEAAVSSRESVRDYFQGVPAHVIELAESETLEYLLDDVDGAVVPSITTIAWGIGDQVFSCDSLDVARANGLSLLDRQFMLQSDAISAWQTVYELTESQVVLLQSIHRRKVASFDRVINLSPDEVRSLCGTDPDGMDESIESFGEIGVKL